MADPNTAPVPTPIASAPPEVLELVRRFAEHLTVYRGADYNETQLRRDFLDPFFGALGWDVANSHGYAEAYREVVHEDRVKVGGMTKAPDYSFRVGGVRKFFLEAKRPSVDLGSDPKPAYQLRRYAWSAKLPLSILSDFEELVVYDCRAKPEPTDKASASRVKVFHYLEFPARWDELAEVFSREAILKGAFDQYADSTRSKRGTATVDDAFLADLESWRELLARHIALRNAGISVRSLNEAVQKTLDRIVFLRICEDRGIEPYGQLQGLLNGTNVYARLAEIFERADQRYNSGLFHFRPEKGRLTDPDDWTLRLRIDDKPLKDILKHLYYPDSPYEFSIIPADLLGHVYEGFLGKVIRLTAGGRAVVEAKPEVRKAGGVHYTPTFVVDHIVRHTIGPLLSAKNPVEVADLKILDFSCGSGSFLLGVYQYLLDWHLDWYTSHNPAKFKDAVRPTPDGGWALTMAERKRILTANIFGVDIDAQAVEVTKLSLLLKVLEGESAESLTGQFRLLQERALPDLDQNIQCGNSLIGPDFYQGHQLALLDDDTTRRVNAFDWHAAFPAIMNRGGFDAIVGNPPYVRIQVLREWAPMEVDFYKQRYKSAGKGNYDLYVVFVERGLQLLNAHGRLGFILPHKFFNAQYGQPLRDVLAAGHHLSEVIHFGDQQIFGSATTYTCLMFLDKAGSESVHVTKVDNLAAWKVIGEAPSGEIAADKITAAEWNFVVSKGADLFERLREMPVKLGDVADIFQGLVTGADSVFIMRDPGNIERELLRPFLKPKDLVRYGLPQTELWMLFPYRLEDDEARLIPARQLEDQYPYAWTFLKSKEQILRDRERGKWRDVRDWHAFGRSQNLSRMTPAKLIVQVLALKPTVILDNRSLYMTGGGSGPFYGIVPRTDSVTIEYLLGLMNSRTFGHVIKSQSTMMRGGYLKFSKQYITSAPIRTIDPASPADVRLHDDVVALVHRMLELHKRLAVEKSSHDRTLVQRQIEATDKEIDRLVYALYGLSEAEVAIVEGR